MNWILFILPPSSFILREKVPHRDLAEDAQAFAGEVEEAWPFLAVGGRLHDQDADGVDIAVAIAAGLGALLAPVREGRAVFILRVEGAQAFVAAAVVAVV